EIAEIDIRLPAAFSQRLYQEVTRSRPHDRRIRFEIRNGDDLCDGIVKEAQLRLAEVIGELQPLPRIRLAAVPADHAGEAGHAIFGALAAPVGRRIEVVLRVEFAGQT